MERSAVANLRSLVLEYISFRMASRLSSNIKGLNALPAGNASVCLCAGPENAKSLCAKLSGTGGKEGRTRMTFCKRDSSMFGTATWRQCADARIFSTTRNLCGRRENEEATMTWWVFVCRQMSGKIILRALLSTTAKSRCSELVLLSY